MTTPTAFTLVTGASQGIGAATARSLAQRGHALIIHFAHRADLAQAVAADCLRLGAPSAIIAQADLAAEAQVLSLFAAVDKASLPLTGLVNNAGIVDQTARLDAMSTARLQRMLAVNVLGPMLCAREAVRRMSRRHGGQGGVIVNVSSSAVRSGSPAQYVDYAASKGAIDVFTQGLAREVAGEGVRVSAVRPGITDTGIHATGGEPDRARLMAPALPMGRAAHPEEVAQAIAWLMSDEASYTAGAILDVSGGR
ncbi:MAG: SDR family oxidoreductase [Proteobacteria bacterium]|uniref:SDR family oxidoreductase n=1 Tax=Aquabacterium sp. TaxID=1872578 RepID=UPI0035C69C99|nr:SDR family oxidoreductase [Pseudomonadota bacterium]